MALTGFTLNGLNLRTVASDIRSPNGWDVFPGMNDLPRGFIFRHGEDLNGRRFYRPRDIDLNLVILTGDVGGSPEPTVLEQVEKNMGILLGALHNTFGTIPLVRTLPSGNTRTAHVRPLSSTPIGELAGPSRALSLGLSMGYPFWHGASDSASGTPTISPNYVGNAPSNDMVFTFTTAGRITHDLTGDWIESDDAGLVVDVGTGEITGGNSGAIHANRPWWIQFEPGPAGTNDLTVTGGSKLVEFKNGYF